jgi:Ca-activated chloride channel family protein
VDLQRHLRLPVGAAGLLLLSFLNPLLATEGKVRIPNRASGSLFKGEQGKQRTEIHYDPATGLVTMKLLVQDPSGYFIPNIRRENLVVYENGVRQSNAAVEIEHAPVSLALLMEYGGRNQALNKELADEVNRAAHQLLEMLGREDKIAIWKYGDTPEQLAGFSPRSETLAALLYTLKPPEVWETNLYDALVSVSDHMRPVAGRKAIILLSSGVDTFSKATYQDALNKIRESNTPLYAIGLGAIVRQAAELHGIKSALARVDWKRAESELQEMARISGGRAYFPETTFDLSGTYDDILENLRVRYVITYKSSTNTNLSAPRTVRVELVNPKTGGPLQIVDANGRTIPFRVIVQDSYTPSRQEFSVQ